MENTNLPESAAAPFLLSDAARRALFLEARSNVAFADAAVDPTVVRRVWDLAKWGPTSNNTQPLRLVIASSGEAREAVLAAAAPGNRPKLEQAPLIAVAAHDDRFHDHHDVWAGGNPAVFDRFEADPAGRSWIARSGSMLQLGYVIVGLRGEGLAVRPYGGFDRAALDRTLMPEHWRAEVLLGIGYPAEDHGAGDRKGRIPADTAVRVL
ncbi:malonic semialdehyde reductase [Demequina sp. SYSU T00039]|uniref:Malonic semialdehyde reductase n=1 Tax=Demequina lignilytica TaxID=3051663 RepID=A0AAW7M944_9MICO|nr:MULTISPECIES: malonic semialdehyde reductase [unclassified Demequina]MDN4478150.1 malonic semialdehyde reductase [Demequina sp. SYSU T00039-1]MDN4488400.1 malonic semialdehyde reductase [Demequina sp. SYSU T00039]MDN4490053.1 malonic semialdehyde reductase [Demequina sp. SYSU T00068]